MSTLNPLPDSKTGVSRISISLPEALLRQLDKMVGDRGFESRSRAISDMITRQLAEHLADIQHLHINGVISSLHVQLVQGPALILQRILDRLATCRGVITGKLQLTASVLPPLHPLPA